MRRRGVSSLATISDNTNSDAAANGQLLQTSRQWIVAKNPSWRSRTQFWTRTAPLPGGPLRIE